MKGTLIAPDSCQPISVCSVELVMGIPLGPYVHRKERKREREGGRMEGEDGEREKERDRSRLVADLVQEGGLVAHIPQDRLQRRFLIRRRSSYDQQNYH